MEEHCLQLLLSGGYGDSPPDFFNGCLDAPSIEAVTGAMTRLETVGALIYSIGSSLAGGSEKSESKQQQQQQQQRRVGGASDDGWDVPVFSAAAIAEADRLHRVGDGGGGGDGGDGGGAGRGGRGGRGRQQELSGPASLTPLGRLLAQLPVDVRVGKMLIFGAILQAIEPVATAAACASHRSPFSSPPGRRQEANAAHVKFKWGDSDLLSAVKAFDEWTVICEAKGRTGNGQRGGVQAARMFCRRNFLNHDCLSQIGTIRRELLSMMNRLGFTRNKGNTAFGGGRDGGGGGGGGGGGKRKEAPDDVIKAAIVAGLGGAGHIASVQMTSMGGKRTVELKGGEAVKIHPGSVVSSSSASGTRYLWLTFLEKVKTSQVFLRTATLCRPEALILFAPSVVVHHQERRVCADNWIDVRAAPRTGVVFKHVREAFNGLLERKILDPSLDLETEAAPVAEAVALLLTAAARAEVERGL